MKNIDVVKTWFTMITALVVVGFGLFVLYATRSDPNASRDVIIAISGFIGMALQFLFQSQTQSATAHQTNVAASTLTGTPVNGSTVTTSSPSTVTVETPAEVEKP